MGDTEAQNEDAANVVAALAQAGQACQRPASSEAYIRSARIASAARGSSWRSAAIRAAV